MGTELNKVRKAMGIPRSQEILDLKRVTLFNFLKTDLPGIITSCGISGYHEFVKGILRAFGIDDLSFYREDAFTIDKALSESQSFYSRKGLINLLSQCELF